MRAAPFPPDVMPADVRDLHDDMAAQVRQHMNDYRLKPVVSLGRLKAELVGHLADVR